MQIISQINNNRKHFCCENQKCNLSIMNMIKTPTNKKIYWRVSVRHYDFTHSTTAFMCYCYHSTQPQDMWIENKENGWKGWTEIKYFDSKEKARGYMLELEKSAS